MLYSTLQSLLSLIICSFVTSCNKFLFAHNLDYWFLGTSYFVYVDISDHEYVSLTTNNHHSDTKQLQCTLMLIKNIHQL